MEETKILVWEAPNGINYYDVSTDELLQGAALHILRERMEREFFSQPQSLKINRNYQKNKQKIATLEMIIGDSEGEAFEDMREQLEHLRNMNETHEQRHAKRQQEWDNIVHCLHTQDGPLAVMILTNRARNYGEGLQILDIPKYAKKQNAETKA